MSDLVQAPDGRWVEPRPDKCALGFPLGTVLVGWAPCGCAANGHRTYYCRAADHGHTEEDRFLYVPPLGERCKPVHPQAPGSAR